jgi:hypothetical protein
MQTTLMSPDSRWPVDLVAHRTLEQLQFCWCANWHASRLLIFILPLFTRRSVLGASAISHVFIGVLTLARHVIGVGIFAHVSVARSWDSKGFPERSVPLAATEPVAIAVAKCCHLHIVEGEAVIFNRFLLHKKLRLASDLSIDRDVYKLAG